MERIKKLKEFLAANPGDSFLMHALALEYIAGDNDADARELFEQVLRNDPTYVGSYYHLAKLLERNGDEKAAIYWYEKGMEQASKAGDNHALNELRAAHDDITE